DPMIAVPILQVHAARIGGGADVVRDKNQKCVRVGVFYISFNSGGVLSMRGAPRKILYCADEENLKGRHQGWRARTIQHLSDSDLGKIEIVQAEVAQVSRNQVLKKRLPALVAEENFIPDEDVSRPQFAAGDFRDELFRGREAASRHQKPSRMSLTSARAKSRDMRCSAGVCSSKKLLTWRETWYCSRNV